MTTTASTSGPLGAVGRLLLLALLLVGFLIAGSNPYTLFFYSSYAILGGLLVVRRPRRLVGWLLVGLAFGFVGTTTPADIDVEALLAGRATWPDFLAVWASLWSGYATFTGFVALMLVFPSGRLPERRRRLAQGLLVACVTLAVTAAIAPDISYAPDEGVTTLLVPNRFAILPDLALWQILPVDLFIVPMLGFLVVGIGVMLARYRRAEGVERLQLRWLVAALAAVVLGVGIGLATIAVFGDSNGIGWFGAIIAYPMVPAAIFIATTRYRLYEIDRIVSRTLGWILVTAVLATVFAAGVIGLQAVLAPVTGTNTLAVAVSTLVAAALFQPLRSRIQRLVDRRFNRARLDADRVATHFAAHLREIVDLGTLDARMRHTVDEAVAPTTVGVWLRPTRDSR